MLSQALKQRGYEVISQGKESDILLPKTEDSRLSPALNEILYSLMSREAFRKNLRDWAYGNVINEKALETIKGFIAICGSYDKSFQNIAKRKEARILKYAHTFEWYISELMTREFGAKASGFNIRLAEVDPDDEFDCIALIDEGLVFVECKTGKGEIFKEFKKFVHRDEELAAAYSFFIFDRDYTFKKDDKEDLPDIKKSEAKRLGLLSIKKINASGAVFYKIVSDKRYFLATSGFDNLKKRLRLMIRYVFLTRDEADTKKAFKETIVSFARDA